MADTGPGERIAVLAADAFIRERMSLAPDVFLHQSTTQDPGQDDVPAGHEVAALIIIRDDGTCTVAWGRGWGVFDRMPGVWANEKEAKRTVERVIGHVVWHRTEPDIWEGLPSVP